MTDRDLLGVLAMVLTVVAFALPLLGLWIDKGAKGARRKSEDPHA